MSILISIFSKSKTKSLLILKSRYKNNVTSKLLEKIIGKLFYKYCNKNCFKILNLKSPYIEKAIFESCKIKKLVVEKDEKEKGMRKILNFGHTFAHAFEATLGYSKKLNHGEAVILGINTALNFSLKNNLLNKKDYFLINKHAKLTQKKTTSNLYYTS